MAIQATPPLTNELLDIQQSWRKFLRKINAQFGDTGLSKTLFVDRLEGDDTKAVRGSIAFKYATIQAALDAALAGDVVLVSPGTYIEVLTWPEVDNITLKGFGTNTVLFNNTVAAYAIEVVPLTQNVSNLSIRDIGITGSSGAILFDGETMTTLGQAGELLIENVTTGDAMRFVSCDNINMKGIVTTGAIEFWDTGSVSVEGSRLGVVTVQALGTVPHPQPTDGRGAVVFNSTIAGNLIVNGGGQFAGSDDVVVGDISNAPLMPILDTGSIMMSGRVLGNVTIYFDTTVPGLIPLILDQARISGTFFFSAYDDSGISATCRAIGAIFHTTGANNIEADSDAIVDLRGSLFDQDCLASSNTQATTAGAFDRTDYWETEAQGSGVGPFVHTLAIPYPAGAVDYTVVVEAALIDDAPVQIDAKAATSFSRVKTADTGALRYHIIRPYD